MQVFSMRGAAALLMLCPAPATAAEFIFSGSSGVHGQAGASLEAEGVTMSISAGPSGAVLAELGTAGIGVNSRSINGAVDAGIDKFDLLGGALEGQGESIRFSFDHDGVITGLLFDGVKDESFEFFRFESPEGKVLSIFDSQIGLRLRDIALIDEPNLTLLSEEGDLDDDLYGLAIPFIAGDVFSLTYAEYSPSPDNYADGFTPLQPNGSRFQGVVVSVTPEPTGLCWTLACCLGALSKWRINRNACRTS